MSKIIILIVGLITTNIKAQDTIFTVDNDTILVNISSYNKNKIIYTKINSAMPKIIKQSKISRIGKDSNLSDLSRNIMIVTPKGCSYVRLEKDKFTNEKIAKTPKVTLHHFFNERANISFERIDSTYHMHLSYKNEKINNLNINKEGVFIFKLANESVIRVSSNSDYREDKTYNELQKDYTAWVIPTYSISKNQLKLINIYGIKEIKIYLNSGFVEHEIPKDFSKNVQEIASCIIAEQQY